MGIKSSHTKLTLQGATTRCIVTRSVCRHCSWSTTKLTFHFEDWFDASSNVNVPKARVFHFPRSSHELSCTLNVSQKRQRNGGHHKANGINSQSLHIGLDGVRSGESHRMARHTRNLHGLTPFLIGNDNEKPSTNCGSLAIWPTKRPEFEFHSMTFFMLFAQCWRTSHSSLLTPR